MCFLQVNGRIYAVSLPLQLSEPAVDDVETWGFRGRIFECCAERVESSVYDNVWIVRQRDRIQSRFQ